VTTALPTLMRQSRNRSSGSIGWRVRRSQATKPTSPTTATTKAPATDALVHPRSGPSMMPNTSAPRPTRDRRAPTGSSGVTSGSRDVGEKNATAASTASTTGTLASTAEPHQKRSSSAPDTIGPRAPPAPAKPAHMAIALRRSWGGKIVAISDMVAGMTKAAPMPVTTRPAMTWVELVPMPATTAPAANTTRPNMSACLRPKRSPSAPAGSRRAAKTRA
jgi:hypothetical protein